MANNSGVPSDALKELPIELMLPRPRRVRVSATGWTNVFACAVFFLVGAAILIKGAKEANQLTQTEAVLRERGGESLAQVTERWTQGRSSVPYVSYSFSVDGSIYTGKSDVPRKVFSSLHVADPLRIRYLPANPNINHPAAWEDSTASLLFGPFMLAGPMAFVGLTFVKRMPRQRRLAVEGIGARGCVTECSDPSRAGFLLTYTFKNADTGELEVGSCRSDYGLKAGSDVWVLYLPRDPSRSEIYPFNVDFYRIDS